MIHVLALPGTPAYGGGPQSIIDQAVEEAKILRDAGFDAIIIENMHDTPYLNRSAGPEITAMMSVVGRAVRAKFDGPIGVQVLAGANKQALAVALAADLDFIRAEGFVFSHIADEGQMDGEAGELLRYRRAIGADHIKIVTDVKKKHSAHAITADVNIAATAKAAEFFRADGIIVTGAETGTAASPAEIQQAKAATRLPVWVGSGITNRNIEQFQAVADGLIIGSWLKEDGDWRNAIDPARARAIGKYAVRSG